MKGKTILAGLFLALGVAALAGAQTLAVQDTLPVADGVMQKGEYAQAQSVGPFWLGAALSKDGSTLAIGIAAKSTGWISVGLGSTRMNGAYIVIGFDNNGNATISEEIGKGHGHSPSGVHKLTASAVKAANGQTTLEFTLPAAEFVKNGKLDLILGASNKADLVSFHPLFKAVTLGVK